MSNKSFTLLVMPGWKIDFRLSEAVITIGYRLMKIDNRLRSIFHPGYANSVGIARGLFLLSLFRDHPPPIKQRRKLCYKSPDSQQKYRIK